MSTGIVSHGDTDLEMHRVVVNRAATEGDKQVYTGMQGRRG